jgi:hypothetical protein
MSLTRFPLTNCFRFARRGDGWPASTLDEGACGCLSPAENSWRRFFSSGPSAAAFRLFLCRLQPVWITRAACFSADVSNDACHGAWFSIYKFLKSKG